MRACPALAVLALAALGAGCDSHPYDASQKPVVTVSAASGTAAIAWSPAGAQLVRIYRGATAGDGYGPSLVWSVASTGGANGIAGPVTVGTVPPGAALDGPAQPLVAGETYTAEVTRADPKGSGDGFTGTRRRYAGTATFVR